MWPQIWGILDFGFWIWGILDFGFGDFGFWILDFGDFGFWILGILDFGFWGFWILDFGPLCSKSLCDAPNAPKFGGFWILDFGDFGDFGFWILGILDFGVWGFWILDFVTNFGCYIRKRRLCTPNRVGGFPVSSSQVQPWSNLTWWVLEILKCSLAVSIFQHICVD